ncbi:MAG: hypothetical protein QNJ42_11325 [Crocosphaera sp.]|nr:hypothetical protein [Crocosphaera sp.]
MSYSKICYYGAKNFHLLPQIQQLPQDEILAMKAVAQVLPFRTNNYVVEELINWDNIPDDPIFRLTFPHRDMLPDQVREIMVAFLQNNASKATIRAYANEIRQRLNPHPGGQKECNVPTLNQEPVPGVQHKYRETLLVFPTAGQSCHAYCTFCFRWPQFVGVDDWKFATREQGLFLEYLRQHKEITDVLITGGDPMTMQSKILAMYIEPLLGEEFEHIQNIRIGTKSLSYWPYRYLTDPDADDVIQLFEKVIKKGKHLALMAHFNHWQELETSVVHRAIQRIRSTGAEIRCQSPLVSHINDSAFDLAKMWQMQVKEGCIPYYLFVERPTGANQYFEISLLRAWELYQEAIQKVSGLARTVRGPVMSCFFGKVQIQGVADVQGEKVFVLSFLQGRDSNWCHRPFFARFDLKATWFNDLVPAFEEGAFFFNSIKSTPDIPLTLKSPSYLKPLSATLV